MNVTRKTTDLTPAERAFLDRQGRLRAINLLDSNLMGIDRFRTGGGSFNVTASRWAVGLLGVVEAGAAAARDRAGESELMEKTSALAARRALGAAGTRALSRPARQGGRPHGAARSATPTRADTGRLFVEVEAKTAEALWGASPLTGRSRIPGTTAWCCPNQIVQGTDGAFWGTLLNRRLIRFSIDATTIQTYNLPYDVQALTAGPGGRMWFISNDNVINAIALDGSIASLPVALGSAVLAGVLAPGPDRNMWATIATEINCNVNCRVHTPPAPAILRVNLVNPRPAITGIERALDGATHIHGLGLCPGHCRSFARNGAVDELRLAVRARAAVRRAARRDVRGGQQAAGRRHVGAIHLDRPAARRALNLRAVETRRIV
jgi:hypothetical protein